MKRINKVTDEIIMKKDICIPYDNGILNIRVGPIIMKDGIEKSSKHIKYFVEKD